MTTEKAAEAIEIQWGMLESAVIRWPTKITDEEFIEIARKAEPVIREAYDQRGDRIKKLVALATEYPDGHKRECEYSEWLYMQVYSGSLPPEPECTCGMDAARQEAGL